MIALHIIHKTKSAPAFIYATFEQADNIRLPNNQSVEDENGEVINKPAKSDNDWTTPKLTYMDSQDSPHVETIPPGSFCLNPGNRLYYEEIPTVDSAGIPLPPNMQSTPTNGKICVNKRKEPIPREVIATNFVFHAAIKGYNRNNSITDSPWLFYKLVNVQSVPFNGPPPANAVNDANAMQRGNYYQSNIVLETDYTLQQYAGRVAGDGKKTGNKAPTLYPPSNDPYGKPFQNVYLRNSGNTAFTHYSMGGCMGCHGNAQYNGHDFSFLIGGNAADPETTDPTARQAKASQELLFRRFGDLQSAN
jgi:hypothetical protein